MVFRTIGFHTDLILNRLRNEKCMRYGEEDAEQRKQASQTESEEAARTHLKFVKRRLADLAEFERRARGIKD